MCGGSIEIGQFIEFSETGFYGKRGRGKTFFGGVWIVALCFNLLVLSELCCYNVENSMGDGVWAMGREVYRGQKSA